MSKHALRKEIPGENDKKVKLTRRKNTEKNIPHLKLFFSNHPVSSTILFTGDMAVSCSERTIGLCYGFSIPRRYRTISLPTRFARWHIFQTKILFWVNFVGTWNGRCWYIFGYLVYFMVIWYILWLFCKFCD
jgi:hypothetical protein